MTLPTLYIIMRRDIQDMNPGKAMAQSAHAQADFHNLSMNLRGQIETEYRNWCEDRTFGRTLVVYATLDEIREIVDRSYCAGMVTDPTYPWRNYYGELCVSEEITCGWVFSTNQCSSENIERMSKLPLVE